MNRSVVVPLMFLLTFSGCGGNRLFTNKMGEVVSGELVLEDLPQSKDGKDYRLDYGEVIDVLFLYNSEYTRMGIKVRPDGKIAFPYIGELLVAGMEVAELDSIMTSRYSEIIREPDITVIVREFKPQLVYVMGEVSVPGGYDIKPGMTLLKVLALGGGVTNEARHNGVLVIRRVAEDHIVGVQIDLKELIDDHRFDLDIPIEPYDIVLVPKSRIAKTQEFVAKLYDIIYKPGSLYLTGWQVANVKILYDFYRRGGLVAK